jgi:predicted O-methyltransferase YrrM
LAPTPTLRHSLLGRSNGNAERRIGWIADAVTVLNSPDSNINWTWLMDTARKNRMVLQLKTRIGLLHELFHTLVPSAVAAEVQETPVSNRERLEIRFQSLRNRNRILRASAMRPGYLRDKLNTPNRVSREKVPKCFGLWPKMNFLEVALAKLTGVESLLAYYAMKSSHYSFTQDYVTDRISVWNQHLAELRAKENLNMLEVGSFEGRSAIWFLDNVVTHPSSTITCIDDFAHRIIEIRFNHNIEVSTFSSRVKKIKGSSQNVLRLFRDEQFDLIYVDANHRAEDVRRDAALSWPLVKRGGVVIFDDYLWELKRPAEDRPQMAIDQFLIDFGSELEILHRGFQVIVRKLSGNVHC